MQVSFLSFFYCFRICRLSAVTSIIFRSVTLHRKYSLLGELLDASITTPTRLNYQPRSCMLFYFSSFTLRCVDDVGIWHYFNSGYRVAFISRVKHGVWIYFRASNSRPACRKAIFCGSVSKEIICLSFYIYLFLYLSFCIRNNRHFWTRNLRFVALRVLSLSLKFVTGSLVMVSQILCPEKIKIFSEIKLKIFSEITVSLSHLLDELQKCKLVWRSSWINCLKILMHLFIVSLTKRSSVEKHWSYEMEVEVEIANTMRARNMNHRQFKTLLEQMDSEYGKLLLSLWGTLAKSG